MSRTIRIKSVTLPKKKKKKKKQNERQFTKPAGKKKPQRKTETKSDFQRWGVGQEFYNNT